ncbi:DUF3012 domain-containing protein [Arsukibacterium sp.]|uniref:DUF3012 domain-containing protein n=1 Tax=Arsukibacterium sp. TaxID=1977258 RepID=UPI00299D0EF6|nr:DUF3012 domain-containing protein [Arsukibacterium sp.]MDX1536281.1 DUF3012 domain-containing protein [Arsukibacterium sp.]
MKLEALILLATTLLLTGCAPEVGSKKWCEQLENKPKGDWSANEVKDFAKHCIFSSDE